MINKGLYDKGFIWNSSNCECECDKSCDVGEYLDYENCKCRKKLVDKLVKECTENIDEVELARITLAENENKHKYSPCTLYIVLFSIIFTISVGIGTYYFVYCHWYLIVLSLLSVLKQFNELINGKSQTNRNQKSNLLFLQRHDQSRRFRIQLV